MKLSEKQIKEIAENLECGMICYVNKETKEIKTMIDFDQSFGDTEIWEEEFEEIEKNIDQYLKIEKPSSREAYRMMTDFTEEVMNSQIKNRLIYALNRNKPFKNFKYEVDYNEEVRQHWFKFKSKKYQEWVGDYLMYNTNE